MPMTFRSSWKAGAATVDELRKVGTSNHILRIARNLLLTLLVILLAAVLLPYLLAPL